jgi:hypothetical protein
MTNFLFSLLHVVRTKTDTYADFKSIQQLDTIWKTKVEIPTIFLQLFKNSGKSIFFNPKTILSKQL